MSTRRWARLSLVLLWWGTVAASLHDGGAAGQALLQQATGMGSGAALALVLLGCAWDAAIGRGCPSALAYRAAALGMAGMTLPTSRHCGRVTHPPRFVS